MQITARPDTGPFPPFFVMGCRRSGTTLVSQILDNHSRLASFHESYLFNIFHPELRWYGDLADRRNLGALVTDVRRALLDQWSDPPEASALLRAVTAPTLGAVISAVLRLYAESRGKVRGGEKTPEHYEYLDVIQATMPDSPVVFLMRDPRDAVASIRRTMDASLEDGARSWNAALMALHRARRPVHLVKYEELVSDPAPQVRAICAHLGEPYEEDMLTFFTKVPDTLRHRRGWEKLDKPVDKGAIGVSRHLLTESEIARVQSICGDGMEEMGYAFHGGAPSVRVSTSEAAAPGPVIRQVAERLQYYGLKWGRWRRGLIRWRTMLRVRARHVGQTMIGSRRASGG